jgi:hypothetical protein
MNVILLDCVLTPCHLTCSLEPLKGLEQQVLSSGPITAYDVAAPTSNTQNQSHDVSRIADAAPVITVTTNGSVFSASLVTACDETKASGDGCCQCDGGGNNIGKCSSGSSSADSIHENLISACHGQQVCCNEGVTRLTTKILTWPGKTEMKEYVLSMPALPPLRRSRSSSPAPVRLDSGRSGISARGESTGHLQDAYRADSHAANHSESWDDYTHLPTSAAAGNGLLVSAAEIVSAGIRSIGLGSFGKSFW